MSAKPAKRRWSAGRLAFRVGIGHHVTRSDIHARNTFDNRDVVIPQPKSVVVESRPLTYSFPSIGYRAGFDWIVGAIENGGPIYRRHCRPPARPRASH